MQVNVFSLKIHTLAHTRKSVYNTAEQGWDNHGSVRSETSVSTILWDLALLTRKHKIYLCTASCRRQQQDGRRRLKVNPPHLQDVFATFLTHLLAEKSLAADHPSVGVQAAAEFHAIQQSLLHGFSATIFKKYSTAWHQWSKFYKWLEIPANLQGVEDPVLFLQIFAECMRVSLLAIRGIPIKNRSV